jgi:glycosyltransferase involved in cell wall biosynthesis
MTLDPTISFEILNYAEPEPKDARSALINLGIRTGRGRYLAFLDYDDVIYPTAYSRLIDELKTSKCAIAFGRIVAKTADVFQDALIVEKREQSFLGKNVLDLFRANFCPIHSFVIDRAMVPDDELWFDESLSKNEDYDFLVRICAKYPASFNAAGRIVGDYYAKNDGSNTISLPSVYNEERAAEWRAAEEFLEGRRRSLVLSTGVQRSLGIWPRDPNLTIRRLIDGFR